MPHLIESFQTLFSHFQPVFTAPSFQLFIDLMTGWLLSVRHRYITELIFASGNVGKGHWSRFHRFFSRYVWSLDELSLILAALLIKLFAPTGDILLVVDDSLCRKRGLNLFGAGMHHDPLISSRALKLVSWGHDWVVLGLVVRLPAWAPTKVFCLPIAFRLYCNRQGNRKARKKNDTRSHKGGKGSAVLPSAHRTRPQLAIELLGLISRQFPERRFMLVADSLYGGKSVLRNLPANIDLISSVHPGGALYEPAPPRQPGKRGAGRKKGPRLPSLQEWAKDGTRWQQHTFDQYGLHATLQIKTRQGLYYTAGKDRLLTFVLTRDTTGQRPARIFYCTRLDWLPAEILTVYACRWSIEVTFENTKQLLGLEDPANRLPQAVLRTAPLALVLYSLVVAWFDQTGHRFVEFPDRPWYRHKREPSFADMLHTLRRLSVQELWKPLVPKQGCLKKVLVRLTELLCRPG